MWRTTVALVASACLACHAPHRERQTGMSITSAAIDDRGHIDATYTCDGRDTSPPLTFVGVPGNAAALALEVDDPDAPAGTWDHWVIWDIPPSIHSVAGGRTPPGIVGRNSWNRNAWGGPCPPSGEHRYLFKLYALDRMTSLPESAGKRELENAMSGHVLASAEVVGRYRRRNR